MLASINTNKKTIKLVSVPRDSRVNIYNTSGRDKVNSCFYYASLGLSESEKQDQTKMFNTGVTYLENTVSDVLGGVQIDYYLGIDMDALPKIADVMGGVTIDVHQNLYAKNGHDYSSIKIKEGKQKLNGEQLLYYSRYRAYPDGDIGRVAIQQKIMKAIFNEFNIDDLQTFTLPGNFGNLGGVSYWIVNQPERVTFIKDLFNIDAEQLSQDPRSDK